MLGSAKSEHRGLTDREITFEDLQPMWSGYLNVTDRRTDDIAVATSNTA